MKDIPSQRGSRYIRQLVSQGEHVQQDFKFLISDAHKIARSLSAFANNSGGRLLIGVKDNGTVAGVRNEEDIYVVEQAAQLYCRPEVDVDFRAYGVSTGVTVIVASVGVAPRRPVCARAADGKWTAYYRVADENIVAHPLMPRVWELHQNPDRPLMLTLGTLEKRILTLLDDNPGGLDTPEIALSLHASTAATQRSVTALAAAGVIDFCFDGTAFRLCRT